MLPSCYPTPLCSSPNTAAHAIRFAASSLSSTPKLSAKNQDPGYLSRFIETLKPSSEDPTVLVLKAHLLAEETMYLFIERQAHRPECLSDARLGFAQLVALSKSFHRYSRDNWWGWTALKKLNKIRNLLAHNLEPKDLKELIVDFSVYVAESVGVTTDSTIGDEYARLAKSGTHPFFLALVALHLTTCATLGFDPSERLSALAASADSP